MCTYFSLKGSAVAQAAAWYEKLRPSGIEFGYLFIAEHGDTIAASVVRVEGHLCLIVVTVRSDVVWPEIRTASLC